VYDASIMQYSSTGWHAGLNAAAQMCLPLTLCAHKVSMRHYSSADGVELFQVSMQNAKQQRKCVAGLSEHTKPHA
jgi:hypothetical protein